MAFGNMGKVLEVDLASGTTTEFEPDEAIYRDFIGGYGVGARIVFSRQKAGVDPLGPDNTLGFMGGPLTGTGDHVDGKRRELGVSFRQQVTAPSSCR